MNESIYEKYENPNFDISTLHSMTREQAVELVGEQTVDNLERENCEFRNEQNGLQEWTASVTLDGGDLHLIAHYYMADSKFYDRNGEPIEDLSNLDWEIDHFSIA